MVPVRKNDETITVCGLIHWCGLGVIVNFLHVVLASFTFGLGLAVELVMICPNDFRRYFSSLVSAVHSWLGNMFSWVILFDVVFAASAYE